MIAADAPAPLQVTVTVPVPGPVRVPMTHGHDALPLLPAVVGTRPAAVLGIPAGVTYRMEHVAPGAVCTVTLARPPGRPPCTEVNRTPAGIGGGAGGTVAVPVAVGEVEDGAGAAGGATNVAVRVAVAAAGCVGSALGVCGAGWEQAASTMTSTAPSAPDERSGIMLTSLGRFSGAYVV